MRTVKFFIFVMILLLSEASISTLDAQSRFNSQADSLDWWNNRRFKLSGIKPYTQAELDSMKAEALRKGTPTVVQPKEEEIFPDTTTGIQAQQTLFKAIRTGDETTLEPMIAVSPINRNNFVAVYVREVAGALRPCASYTLNGGDNWYISDIPTSWAKYTTQGDPTVAFDKNGNAWYCYIDFDKSAQSRRNSIVVGQSLSQGSSWSNQYIVVDDYNAATRALHDKPWVACDQTTGPYSNSVYVSWTWFRNNEDSSRIFLSFKREGSSNFSAPVPVSSWHIGEDFVQGSQPIIGPDGLLYVFWLKDSVNERRNASLWMNKSTDGGQTFGQETEIIPNVKSIRMQALGGSFQRSNSFPSVAIRNTGSSNYEIYLVWSDLRFNEIDVLYSKSTDKGTSWSSPWYISSTSNEQFLPAVTTNTQGTIIATYFERVSSSSNNIELKVAVSTDGGFSWSTSYTSFSQFPGNVLFTGDYIGVAANEYTYWAIWPGLTGNPPNPPHNNDIFGSYRGVSATIRNDLPGTTHIRYNGVQRTSPYTTPYEVAGVSRTIRASDPVTIGGTTYVFSRWEDQNGNFISGLQTATVPIQDLTYIAKFSQIVTVYVRNEFKEPSGQVSYGGMVNVDNVDYNTDLTGSQATFQFGLNSTHRFEAREQMRGAYYRGFNPRTDRDGGWVYPNLVRDYSAVTNPQVQAGPYTAKYRNRYDITVTAATYIEPGSGGTYRVNGTNVGTPWSGNIWQYESINIETVPPPGYICAGWSDGETANPRILSPIDHISELYSIYKIPMKSNVLSAVSGNTQRKLVKATDLFLTYESAGRLFLTRSTNGANT